MLFQGIDDEFGNELIQSGKSFLSLFVSLSNEFLIQFHRSMFQKAFVLLVIFIVETTGIIIGCDIT